MSNTAIKVENLSKIYRLGEIGTGTISRDMERWFKTKVLKQEDPFLKIGETNDRANKGMSDIVYSLQDINFEINQGDAVGIIGRNGAGKSTLLKILSRVTTPTTGRINIKGRVASLLEVGTGFHPELTGRENIYLNGAILGMRKREIDRKLDEIIDFSGVERYIDTPVKRYSSGMYVRLAFAVAAHLESEILIVDEVLAVGDAEFQKKCLGKMGEVSKGEGRTVLFVSHNMASIKSLCSRALLLEYGTIKTHGGIEDVVNLYFNDFNTNDRYILFHSDSTKSKRGIVLNYIKILDANNDLHLPLSNENEVIIEISYSLDREFKDLRISMDLMSADGVIILVTSDFTFQNERRIRKAGHYKSRCIFPREFFNSTNYFVAVNFEIPNIENLLGEILVPFKISQIAYNQLGNSISKTPPGLIHPFLVWTYE
jgi:lipopolysaccharide transport system ATP-binding protein